MTSLLHAILVGSGCVTIGCGVVDREPLYALSGVLLLLAAPFSLRRYR